MDVEGYEEFDRLLGVCRENSIRAEVSLAEPVSREALEKMIAAGADSFLMDMEEETGWAVNAEALRTLDFSGVRLRWFMHRDNAQDLPRVIRRAEDAGAKELIITGMKPCAPGLRRKNPDREQIIAAAEIINGWQKENLRNGDAANEPQNDAAKEVQDGDTANEPRTSAPDAATGTTETADAGTKSRMELAVESCFSPLRAVMGGADEKRNGNRGIGRGCEAGSGFFAVQADGRFTPCPYLDAGETYSSITEYWERSPALKNIRKQSGHEGCPYARRCLPCLAAVKEADDCPVSDYKI
jgi:MoaA/NifB/PqqE/SkfB family radical SAM enzyme